MIGWHVWLLLIGSMMSSALIDAARAGALAVDVINDWLARCGCCWLVVEYYALLLW
jgi:hypothetical protein